MKKVIAIVAIMTGSAASAQNQLGVDYCTRGEVITGAIIGAGVGYVAAYTSQMRFYANSAKMTIGKTMDWVAVPAKDMRNPRVVQSLKNTYGDIQDWTGERLGYALARENTSMQVIATGVGMAGAAGGSLFGAYAGCVAGPVRDNFWEGSRAQAAVSYVGETVTGTVVEAADWTGEKLASAWDYTSSTVYDWWTIPTSIEKRVVPEYP